MLSREDNELLCRVGPGTPMGNLLRRFWTPAMLSDELPTHDCDPVRLRLLGENLIAFRDTEGKVGLVDNYCPHRRASLFFGRNEECGLRCVYHGWKFDVNGNCVDMPSEPAESNFKDKVHITSYPVLDKGGIIWTYMGPKELTPEMPAFEWTDLPDSHWVVAKIMYESNFVQGIEGEIDTVHLGFLHSRLDVDERAKTATTWVGKYAYTPRWSNFHVKTTNYGVQIGAQKPVESDKNYWRIAQWLAPYYTMIPRMPGTAMRVGMWVPMDDEHTWIMLVAYHPDRPPEPEENATQEVLMLQESVDRKTWLPEARMENDFLIDREQQKTFSYSGIPSGFGRSQDAAMVESMGSITDRTHEHLGTTDRGIIGMRNHLLRAAKDLQEGIEPFPATNGNVYQVRSAAALLPQEMAYEDDPATRKELFVKPQ